MVYFNFTLKSYMCIVQLINLNFYWDQSTLKTKTRQPIILPTEKYFLCSYSKQELPTFWISKINFYM